MKEIEYKAYQKMLEAVERYTGCFTKCIGIEFDGRTCTIRLISGVTEVTIIFKYSSKMTIKEIGKRLEIF